MRTSRNTTRWRLSVISLASVLVAGTVSAVSLVTATSAYANNYDRPTVTYNMLGGSTEYTSKWGVKIATLAENNSPNPPVIALQEAGGTTPASVQNSPVDFPAITPIPAASGVIGQLPTNPNGHQVRHVLWQSGSNSFRDVYFLQTDRNGGAWTGGHVNLAIVSPHPADEVIIIPNPIGVQTGFAARAALGIRIGNTWYFSVHALSGGGNDAAALVRNIYRFIAYRNSIAGATNFVDGVVMGDFNRDPSLMQPTAIGLDSTQVTLVTGNGATQRAGGALDYGFFIQPDGISPFAFTATIAPQDNWSDHSSVRFDTVPASDPTPSSGSGTRLYPTGVTVTNVQAGGVLDAFNQGTANFTNIDSFRLNNQDNQRWDVTGYPDGSLQFSGFASGRCIDITNSNQNPGSGNNLSLFDCANQASQRWLPIYQGNSEFELQSTLVPADCMNISGGQTTPNVSKQVILYPCQDTPNERFFFTPPASPSATAASDQSFLSERLANPTILQNLQVGGVATVQGAQTANNTPVISYQRNGQSNQGWNLVWDSTNGTFQLKDSNSGRCLDTPNIVGGGSAGAGLVIDDCLGTNTERWKPILLTDSGVQIQNFQNPSLCIDINGATFDPTQGNLDVNTCNSSLTQQWTFTPYDPTGTPTPPSDPDHNELFVRPPSASAGVPAQRIGYYTSWSTYPANAFYPKNLDTEGIAGKLTVLNYAFENIDPVNLTCFEGNKPSVSDPTSTDGNDGSSDAYADYQKQYTADTTVNGTADVWNQPLRGNFQQLKELKAKYPNLKILLSIGGWTYSKYFSDVAATAASRQKFVSSCIDMFIKGNLPQLGTDPAGGPGAAAGIFDGFDLDWEFPGTNLGHVGNHYSAQDGANYTALLQEFRTELDALGGSEHYMLTAVLPAGPANIAQVQPAAMSQYLDYGNVEAYDFHGAFETTGPTNFQSPLYDSPDSPAFNTGFTADSAVRTYLADGFPASKMVLGVPLYGRGWTGVPDGGQHGRYQTATGPTAQFPSSLQPGVADWKELEAAGLTNSWYYDANSESSWIYDGTNFYTIETPDSLADKRLYIQDMGLAGVMMYSLEADDAKTTLINAATGLS